MNESLSTKTKIFNASIDLFSEKGFDNCGVREIASVVNIRPSSIYNYFTSKEQILENIFVNLINEEYRESRTPVDELIEMAKSKPLIEVFEEALYTFNTEDGYNRKRKLFKIISSKLYDCKVADLYHKIYIEEPTQYINELTKNLIKINKIKEQNYELICFILNSFYSTIRQELYLNLYSFEEAKEKINFDEKLIYKILCKYIDLDVLSEENKYFSINIFL